jgi:protein Mpv17
MLAVWSQLHPWSTRSITWPHFTDNSQSPYSVEIRELLIFVSFSIISCPPNYLWQTWLEAAFPGYTDSLTPQEKGKLMDEKVLDRSTATDTTSLRTRNEKQAALTSESAPSPQKAKKQLSIRNTAIKFLLDQSIGAAVNTVMFIMGIAMLRGQSWQYGWEETKTGFWPLVFAGQKLWPLVSIISLTLVPVERRMVFGSVIGVGWGIFLSLMAGGKKHKTA